VTCSGGDAVTAADEAERLGVPLATLSGESVERLRALLPPGVVVTNPLDHTNALWDDTERIRALVDVLAEDPGVSQVLYVQDTPHDLPEEAAAEWARTRDGVVEASPGTPRGVVSALPELMPDDVAESLTARGVTPLLGINAALKGLHANAAAAADPCRLRGIARAARAAQGEPGRWLAEHEAKELLARCGVPVPRGRAAATAEEAVAVSHELGSSVAVKLSHPEVQHKTDIGGLALGLADPHEVREAARRFLAMRPDAMVLVETMGQSGLELLVSVSRDGVVPHLVVGLGGIWTELLADVVIVPLPADTARVREAFLQLRGHPLLTGGRGRPPVDLGAVAGLAVAAAKAFDQEGLSLVELNPVIATPDGALAVDAVIRR
jgi:acyl-CoA synthetase (NDP forming)